VIPVAITTDRFEEASRPFRQLGLEPVGLPCIRVEAAAAACLDQAREASRAAGLLVVSSVRTLDLLWPKRPMPAVPVAAVGDRTAAAVKERGGHVVTVGRAGLAELAAEAAELLAARKTVFPHAEGADLLGLAALRKLATDLLEFEVYRTVPVAPGFTRVLAAAFGSPSAVEGWLLSRHLDDLVIGVIGSTTARAVGRHRSPEVIAPHPTYQALARSLASYLEVAS
jgi:uroporphyrinogen-III synthase